MFSSNGSQFFDSESQIFNTYHILVSQTGDGLGFREYSHSRLSVMRRLLRAVPVILTVAALVEFTV